tara:strand:- start:121 stop:312 length:192 start_codon:yes stop_codon:yes gene_type:complete
MLKWRNAAVKRVQQSSPFQGEFLNPVTGMDMNKYMRQSMRQTQAAAAASLEERRKNNQGRIEV